MFFLLFGTYSVRASAGFCIFGPTPARRLVNLEVKTCVPAAGLDPVIRAPRRGKGLDSRQGTPVNGFEEIVEATTGL